MTREERAKAYAEKIGKEYEYDDREEVAYNAYLAGVKDADSNPAWRMCEEELPQKNDDYIVVDEYNNMFIAFWQDNEWLNDDGYPDRDIIAWLPLPKFNPESK